MLRAASPAVLGRWPDLRLTGIPTIRHKKRAILRIYQVNAAVFCIFGVPSAQQRFRFTY